MSDVLSAEEVRELAVRDLTKYQDPDSWILRLVRSHERMRGELAEQVGQTQIWIERAQKDRAAVGVARAERDEAVEEAGALERMGRSYNDLWRQEKERAEAAARAGGCAADALRPFADFPPITTAQRNRGYISSRIDPAWIDAARDALAAYDRAVSGQTAEKEEA